MMKVGKDSAALRAGMMGSLLAGGVSFHAAISCKKGVLTWLDSCLIAAQRTQTFTKAISWPVNLGDWAGCVIASAAAMFLIALSCGNASAATLYWTNLSGGDWSGASNWKPNQVPGGTDTAFVLSNGTYTISVNPGELVSVSNLTIGASSGTQTLDIAGGLVVNGTCVGNANTVIENVDNYQADTAGGFLNGSGTMTLAGALYWEVPQYGILSGQVNANITLSKISTANAVLCCPFIYSGPVGFTGSEWVNTGSMTICLGPLNLGTGTTLSNAPGATITLTLLGNNPNHIIPTNGIGGSGTFVNNGKLLVSDTNGQDFIQPLFVNNGELVITNGATLALYGGGTNTGFVTNCLNCALLCTNGAYEFDPGSIVDSQGSFKNWATLHIDGTVKCPTFTDQGTTEISGLLQVTNGCIVYGTETLTNSGKLQAGNLYMSSAFNQVSSGSTVSVSNGLTLGGRAVAVFDGILNIGGTAAFNSFTTATLGGTAYFTNSVDIVGGTVTATNLANVSVGNSVTLSSGNLALNGSGPFTAASFIFSNGVQSGTQPLQVSGPLFWSGGTLDGIVDCDGGTVTASNATMTGGLLVNSGTMGWAANPMNMYSGAEISNAASGIINITNSQWNNDAGGGLLANGGTMNLWNTDTINIGLMNAGTININSGTLSTFVGTNAGTMSVASGATLSTANSYTTFSSTGSAAIAGPGTLSVSSGTLNSAGALSLAGGVNGVILNVNGGTANFNGGATAMPSQISFSSGTMSGSQLLSASGPFNWSGGTLEANVECVGGNVTVQGVNSYGGQIVNTGTMGWSANPIYCYPGTFFSNSPTGIINITNDNLYSESGGVFANAGQMNIWSSSAIDIPITNNGAININGGTFNWNGGGTHSGTLTIASGATFQPASGTLTCAPGSTVAGAGALSVSGATVNFNGALNVQGPWQFQNGTVNYNGTTTSTGNICTISGASVNVNGTGSLILGAVNFSGGGLAGSQTITDNGPFNWSGGALSGIILCNGGNVTVPGQNSFGGQIINSGTMGWSPNPLYCYSGTLISNTATGTLNVTNCTMYTEGPSTFANAGQMNVWSSSTIDISLNNVGAMSLNAWTLTLNGGTNSATITVAASATLEPNAGTLTCASGSVVNGAGTLYVNGGTVNFNGALNVQGPWQFPGGTSYYNGTTTSSGNTITVNGGTVSFSGSGNLSPGVLNLSGGTLGGGQTVNVGGPFNWSGGQLSGVVQCSGGNVTVQSANSLGGQIINTGTMAWSPNPIYCYTGTMFSNSPTGVVNATNFVLYTEGPSTFANAGQMNVWSSSTINIALTNTGSLNVNSGTLNLGGGGTNAGTIAIASGSTLQSPSAMTCLSNSAIIGPGTLSITSGTFNSAGALSQAGGVNGVTVAIPGGTANFIGSSTATPAQILLNGGTLAGSELVAASGPFNWSSGAMDGIVQCNGGNVNVSGASINGGQIINTGTMAWTTTPLYSYGASLVSNSPSGVINMTNATIYNESGGAVANAGRLNVWSSSSIYIPLTNNGTTSVNAGALALVGGGSNSGTVSIASGATFSPAGNTFTSDTGSLISGAGNLNVGGGTANFNGVVNVAGIWGFSGGTANYNGTTSSSGMTINVNGGTANFNGIGNLNPSLVTLSSGTLAGSQSIADSGPFNWSGGSMDGVVNCNGGIVNIQGSSMNGGQIINSGTMAWSPSPLYSYGANLISNAPAGVLNMTNATIYNQSGGTLANAGQMAIWSSSYIGISFTNSAAVNISAGILSLGIGTNAGTIAISSGAVLNSSSPFTCLANSSIVGPGTLNISANTFNSEGNLSLEGGASGVIVDITGGTGNFIGSSPATPSEILLSGGTLAGNQLLSASGPFNWSGGSLNGLVQCNGGSLTAQSSSITSGQIINTGTMGWSLSPLYSYGASVISNAPTGMINMTNATIYNESGGAFNNSGRLNVWSSSTMNIPLTNNGTINLDSGTLNLNGGESLANGTLDFGIASLAEFGKLNVPGNVDLAGTVALTLNGYTPLIGDTFNLISYGSESGAFGTFTTPSSANWQEDYGATAFSVQVSNFAAPTNVTLFAAQNALGTNGFTIQVSGPAGSNYLVQVSTNLAGVNWIAVTNFMSTTTLTSVTDSEATNGYVSRFYRASIH